MNPAKVVIRFEQVSEVKQFNVDLPWLVLYLSNFGRVSSFDMTTLIHTWSLAVEEQFYLIWPLVIFALPMRWLKALIILIIIFAPLSRAMSFYWFSDQGADVAGRAAYMLPWNQFDAFATGAAISVFGLQRLPRAVELLTVLVIACAMAGCAVLLIDHFRHGGMWVWTLGYRHLMISGNGYVWGYSLLNFTSAALVIAAMQPSRLSLLLQLAPLRRLGQISYGMYLFHQPLIDGFDVVWPDANKWVTFPIWFCTVVLVSEVSFRYFERPIMRLRDRVSAPTIRVANSSV